MPSAKFDPEEKNSLARLDFIRNALFLVVGILSVAVSLLNASKTQVLISMIVVFGLCIVFVIVRYADKRINALCNVSQDKLKSGRSKGILFSILSGFICFGGMYFALG